MLRVLGVFLCLSVIACGGKVPTTTAHSDTKAELPFKEDMHSSFFGHYATVCHDTYYQGMKTHGISDEIYHDDQSFEQDIQLFWDSSCQVPFGSAIRKGTFSFVDGSEVGLVQNGIFLTLTDSRFMPGDAQVANLMDSKRFSDRADWLAQEWTPVIRKTTNELDILTVQDDSLKTIFRQECVDADQTACLQVTLSRK